MEQNIEKLMEAVNALSARQELLDKKTRDAEAWKEINGRIMKLLKLIIVSFAAVLVCISIVIGFVVISVTNQAFDSRMRTTSETISEEMNAGDNGVIITGDNNETSYGKDGAK